MKVEWFRSATVGISSETGSTILCDPWMTDGAFLGSWYHFPPLEGFEYQELLARRWDAVYISHFHADHYRGLTKSTPPPGCLVWCSRPTAELCASRLGIQRDRLRAVDVGRTIVVDGVRCTFIDANHCPGSVLFLFQLLLLLEGP